MICMNTKIDFNVHGPKARGNKGAQIIDIWSAFLFETSHDFKFNFSTIDKDSCMWNRIYAVPKLPCICLFWLIMTHYRREKIDYHYFNITSLSLDSN